MKLQKTANIFSFYSEFRLRVLIVVGLQVISAFADNLGILGLLPVIQGLVSSGSGGGRVGEFFASVVTSIGLPADMRGYLLLVSIAIVIKAGVQAIVYLVASLFVSFQLTLLALLLGVIKVAVLRPIRHGTIRLGAQYSSNIRAMTVSLLEGLNSIKPIRAMGADRSLQVR